DAYRVVRRTLDEVTDELQRADSRARAAADEAARQAASGELAELDNAVVPVEEVFAERPAPQFSPSDPPPPASAPDPVVVPAPRRELHPPNDPAAQPADVVHEERRNSSLRILRRNPEPEPEPYVEPEPLPEPVTVTEDVAV